MAPKSPEQFENIRNKQKENILRSALVLFSAQGFSGTSIREIAKAAKISDGLLYNYFNSKEELAIEVLKSAFETLDETIVSREERSPFENVKESIENFITLLKNNPEKIRMLAQMGFHKEKFGLLNHMTITKYEDSVDKFEHNFQRMGLGNPRLEAQMLVATLDGIVFECLLMDSPFDLELISENIVSKYCKR